MTDVPRTAHCSEVSGDGLDPLCGSVNDGPVDPVTDAMLLVLFVVLFAAAARIPAVPGPPPAGTSVRPAKALR